MNANHVNIGIDVSKKILTAAFQNGKVQDFQNNKAGIAALIKKAKAASPCAKLCCEATGGYEQPLVQACHTSATPIAVANARQVRDFAKGKGLLAKTDALDARIITRFADENNPRPHQEPPAWATRLRALTDRRANLTADLVRERNRLQTEPDPWVAKDIRLHIRQLQKHIESLEKEIAALRAANPEFDDKAKRLEQIKGIGETTACQTWWRRSIGFCAEEFCSPCVEAASGQAEFFSGFFSGDGFFTQSRPRVMDERGAYSNSHQH